MPANNTERQNSFECLLTPEFDEYNITDVADSVEATWTFFAALNGIASPPTIVINFLIIWTIVMDNNLKKVTHNILLVVLAVTDCLEGLIVEPLYFWYLVALIGRRPIPCQFTLYVIPSITMCCLTLNTLTIISVDMYLAIEHSQFYEKHVTTKKVVIGATISSAANLTIVLVGRVLSNSPEGLNKIPIAIVIAINVFITLYCTIRIQKTANRQRRTIQAQVQAVQQESTAENNRRRQVTMILVVLATFLLYCPYITVVIIEFSKGKFTTNDFQYISHPIGATFIHLQSLVNPIVISLRLSYIREGIKSKLPCCK